ncbi:MAG: DNA-processing protein DprA [Deltaproteobacteria bacterium]|nr:DNA-processing protein DprA [Deltaproteobacteria bacterium]
MSRWTEIDAHIAFASLPGVGDRTLDGLKAVFRSYALAADLRLVEVADALDGLSAGAGSPLRQVSDLGDHLQAVRRAAEACGARLLCATDPGWPTRLSSLRDAASVGQTARPPSLLWVRGELTTLELSFSASLVGARRADGLAREQAHQLAAGLAEAGVSVISGGAAGVDGQAHRGALEAGGHTVAVLGTGVDQAYPRQHRALFEEILEARGALVSEHAPGTGPKRGHFPRRNRIISGLSDLVTVVAAAPGSGALITARLAEAQERGVCAVPGDPRRRLSSGPNQLLVEGALAVLEPWHLLENLVAWGGDIVDGGHLAEYLQARASQGAQGALAMGAQLPISPLASRVLAVLGPEGRSLDELAAALSLSPSVVAGALTELEVGGLAQRVSGAYVLRPTSHPSI